LKVILRMARLVLIVSFLHFFVTVSAAQDHSVARAWNDVLLEAIRNDLARPTVHARNLFHHSMAMYDVWAVYDENARTYFLGNSFGDFQVDFRRFGYAGDIEAAREEAISYASNRLLKHRFQFSPGSFEIFRLTDSLFSVLGYDPTITSTDYLDGRPATLGNYIAEQIILFGLSDGSNESGNYANTYYTPVNGGLFPRDQGVGDLIDPNRWQPLEFEEFIDQSGNSIPDGQPEFLSAEWGNVVPFSMDDSHVTEYTRDGFDYKVFHDPGPPAYIDTTERTEGTEFYRWNHQLVTVWSSHLDPADETLVDIAPSSLGNIDIDDLPTTEEEYQSFYDLFEGGDTGEGYAINPSTGSPYEEQLVKRSDYARILAEFWADGPDSETPPGHWFSILNEVSDDSALQKRMRGEGEILSDLEWDVKAYFLLGGAMHDAAIAAWSIKGYYDYIRPISALRYMASKGQSSDKSLSNYHPAGVALIPGYIEVIEIGDPLSGTQNEHVGAIKFKAWRGHQYIPDPNTSYAGVDWILAADWNPYQRSTFVTPPFAGYVSGHSTYSRAAAEVLTELSGDPFFPGGMGEFPALKNEFLVFEEGPSADVVLQWATYRDASDQCSLSRIWGGIHPPIDDIPGRKIGREVGHSAFNYGAQFFEGKEEVLSSNRISEAFLLFPNPVSDFLQVKGQLSHYQLITYAGKSVEVPQFNKDGKNIIDVRLLAEGVYLLINAKNKVIGKFIKQ
jgi:hypothetical protein